MKRLLALFAAVSSQLKNSFRVQRNSRPCHNRWRFAAGRASALDIYFGAVAEIAREVSGNWKKKKI